VVKLKREKGRKSTLYILLNNDIKAKGYAMHHFRRDSIICCLIIAYLPFGVAFSRPPPDELGAVLGQFPPGPDGPL